MWSLNRIVDTTIQPGTGDYIVRFVVTCSTEERCESFYYRGQPDDFVVQTDIQNWLDSRNSINNQIVIAQDNESVIKQMLYDKVASGVTVAEIIDTIQGM